MAEAGQEGVNNEVLDLPNIGCDPINVRYCRPEGGLTEGGLQKTGTSPTTVTEGA